MAESKRIIAPLMCHCRSFHYPHEVKAHNALPSRRGDDTEQARFDELRATCWWTWQEREAWEQKQEHRGRNAA